MALIWYFPIAGVSGEVFLFNCRNIDNYDYHWFVNSLTTVS